MTLEEKDAFHTTRVRDWVAAGCNSWGVPEQSMTYLADRVQALKIEVNEAAATSIYHIPGHHRWGGSGPDHDDFSTNPRLWSFEKLSREKDNGMAVVVAEWERRVNE